MNRGKFDIKTLETYKSTVLDEINNIVRHNSYIELLQKHERYNEEPSIEDVKNDTYELFEVIFHFDDEDKKVFSFGSCK